MSKRQNDPSRSTNIFSQGWSRHHRLSEDISERERGSSAPVILNAMHCNAQLHYSVEGKVGLLEVRGKTKLP